MVAPYSRIKEIDKSFIVSSGSATTVGIVVPAKRGPIDEPYLIGSEAAYLQNYTVNSKVEVGDTLAHFSALAVLEKQGSLWVQRAVPDDILYGGVIFPAVTAATTVPLSIGLADPTAYIFGDSPASNSSQKTKIDFAASIDGSLGEKYFVLPTQDKYVWYNIAALPQKASVFCVGSTDLAGKYFILPGGTKYVWFEVNSVGVDPAITGKTAIKCTIALATADASQVATEISSAVTADADFTATSSEGTVYISKTTAVGTEHGSAGNSGFSYITTQEQTQASTDPAPTDPAGMTAIQVTIDRNATAVAVAQATASALSAASEVTVTYTAGTSTLVLTNASAGVSTPALEGSSEFRIVTLQYGGSNSGTPALLIYGADPGAWNNDLMVKCFNYETYPDKVGQEKAFIIEVYKKSNLNTPVEDPWLCSLDPSAQDGFGNNIYVEKVLEGSSYIRALVNDSIAPNQMPMNDPKGSSLTKGSDGSPVTDGAMIQALKKAFSNKDEQKVTLIIDGGWSTPAYQTEMIKIAKNRQDCFAILSTPIAEENKSNYLNAIVDYRKNQLNANTSYAAIITPHVKIFDYFNNRDVWAAPDGQLAGALVAADRNFEIWYPVLGFRRGVLDVTGLRRKFDGAQMDNLYANGINPIRFASGKGFVIWGQKTLQAAASALDRINVRMMLIKVEPAIQDFQENYIGEFNTSQTREEIKSTLESYLTDIKARNGCRDFKVVCDLSNNTPQVIQTNQLICWVYLKPPYATEFITTEIIITPESVSFN